MRFILAEGSCKSQFIYIYIIYICRCTFSFLGGCALRSFLPLGRVLLASNIPFLQSTFFIWTLFGPPPFWRNVQLSSYAYYMYILHSCIFFFKVLTKWIVCDCTFSLMVNCSSGVCCESAKVRGLGTGVICFCCSCDFLRNSQGVCVWI